MSWTLDSFSIESEEKANLFLILCNVLFDPASWCSPAPARVVIVILLLSALSGAVQYSTVQYSTLARLHLDTTILTLTCTILDSHIFSKARMRRQAAVEREKSAAASDRGDSITVQYSTVLYCTVLYCTVLYCSRQSR